MTADIGLEWVVAGRGIVLGRVAQTGRWTLAARGLEYLPADLRPARRAVAPDVQAMLGRLTEDAQSLIRRSEEHTSELQSLMRISYAVFCLKKKNKTTTVLTTFS